MTPRYRRFLSKTARHSCYFPSILFLSACVGPLVPVIDIDESTKNALRSEISLYSIGFSPAKSSRAIEPVTATSCMNKLYDETPSRENAEDQLRFKALQAGGNAVTNVICEGIEGTNLAKNCWASVTCHGVATHIPVTDHGTESEVPVIEREKLSTGTGFIVSLGGYVMTAAHVVDGCTPNILTPGGSLPAAVIAMDSTNDVAILQVRNLKSSYRAQIAPGQGAILASDVLVFGFPLPGLLGDSVNATRGAVSSVSGIGNDHRIVQISAAVQQGNSGGPVVDTYGNVIGMIVSKLNAVKVARASGDIPQNVNFAVGTPTLRNILNNFDVPFELGETKIVVRPEDIAAKAADWVLPVACH